MAPRHPVRPESVGLSTARLDAAHTAIRQHVDERRAPGLVVLIARDGKVVYEECTGMRDIARAAPMEMNTLFELASMSKPFTAVAVMQLIEAGRLKLHDPISKYVPALGRRKVYREGWPEQFEPALTEITIHQLLTHTSGLSYGAIHIPDAHVSNLYFDAGVHYNRLIRDCPSCSKTLAEMVERLAKMPLAYEPGTSWEYSIASDVLSHLVEVLSGERFDRYLQTHLFGPLKMVDTHFHVPAADRSRLATVYEYGPDGKIVATDIAERYTRAPTYFGGGGELLSSAPDYLRFAQMLLDGGELEGTRILQAETVKLMTRNHLSEAQRAAMVKQIGTSLEGYGFGYGFAVGLNPAQDSAGTAGEFFWGGGAGTKHWIDPSRQVIGIMMNHVRFGHELPIDAQLKRIVQQALL